MSDQEHSLQTYISDMLALEEHVRVPFTTQMKDPDLPKYPSADVLLRRLTDLNYTHIQSLKAALQASGGHEAHAIKAAVTNIEGWFASAIDKVRKTKVAKALRDDYTAISLCCVSYSMLLTTANAYSSPDIAELARRHLSNYAELIMEIGVAMPEVVVQDLKETGVAIDGATVERTRMQIETAWRISAAAAHSGTTTGEIESEAAINRGASGTYPTV